MGGILVKTMQEAPEEKVQRRLPEFAFVPMYVGDGDSARAHPTGVVPLWCAALVRADLAGYKPTLPLFHSEEEAGARAKEMNAAFGTTEIEAFLVAAASIKASRVRGGGGEHRYTFEKQSDEGGEYYIVTDQQSEEVVVYLEGCSDETAEWIVTSMNKSED
jgi:hypothetical protein